MGVSLRTDRPLIDWLARRGYNAIDPGDVSLLRDLDATVQPPAELDWARFGLRPVALSHQQPWTGPGCDELRLWGAKGGWPYAGAVLVDAAGAAVARVVWRAAAIVRLELHPAWQGRGLGTYLLDRALADMAATGHARVEVQTHVVKHARAYAMYTRRGFVVQDAWASLVKT